MSNNQPQQKGKKGQQGKAKPTKEEIEESRKEELENLQKNLIKKIYVDLFQANVDLYQEKDMTFENFIFYFYQDIVSSIDFNNPNYPLLLKKIDLKVKAKFDQENKLTPELNKIELQKELNKLSQEDEWSLINKYQAAIYKEEQEKIKQESKEKYQKYSESLKNQIEHRKNYVDPIEKQKEDMYLYDEVQAKKQLERLKIDNQNKIEKIRRALNNTPQIKKEYVDQLENENLDLNQDNKEIIKFKINLLNQIEEDDKDHVLSDLVDKIMNEKKIEKINKILAHKRYQEQLNKQMNVKVKNLERPDKMTPEERRINKDLLAASREYFKNKKI